jgi:hypothetical protein
MSQTHHILTGIYNLSQVYTSHKPVKGARFLTVSKQLDCIALKTSNLNRTRYISAMKRNRLVRDHAEIINTYEVLKPGEAGMILRQLSLRPPNSECSLL